MEKVYQSATLSMFLLKSAGLLMIFTGAGYFLVFRLKGEPNLKMILFLGIALGIMNAGLVISLGEVGFTITPAVLIALTVLFYNNKLPRYQAKHLLGLLGTFLISSLTFFIAAAGSFFHLAVEGRI